MRDAGWVRDVPGIHVVDVDGPAALLELLADGRRQTVLREALGADAVREFTRVVPASGRDLPGGDGMTHDPETDRTEPPSRAGCARRADGAPSGCRPAWTLVARREIVDQAGRPHLPRRHAAHPARSSPASSSCRRCSSTRVNDVRPSSATAAGDLDGAAVADRAPELDDTVRVTVADAPTTPAARAARERRGGRRLAHAG